MRADNLLLAALPREVVDRLLRQSRTVDLKYGEVLHRPNQTIRTVYFPLRCLISITVTLEGGQTVEAGAVGNREMVGLNAFMGGRETNQTGYVCQIAGPAVKTAAEPLLDEFDRNKAVRDVLLRSTQAYIAQLSQNVGCIRAHSVGQRLARWLLECRDRLASDDLGLSHEFIGQMLGVRRAGVTVAAGELQKRGVIEYTRGRIRVTDAAGLEAASCECFRLLRDEYTRLLEPMIRANARSADDLPAA